MDTKDMPTKNPEKLRELSTNAYHFYATCLECEFFAAKYGYEYRKTLN